MKKKAKKYLFLGILLVAVVFFFDFGFLKGEITEYSLLCNKEDYVNYWCTKKWLPLNPTTYKPSVARQEVINSTLGSYETLTKCSIVNRRNWTCKYNDESGEFGFKNGQFWEISLGENIYGVESASDNLFEIKHVPKYLYRLEEMKWW